MKTNFYKRFFIITIILILVIGVFVYVNYQEFIAAVVITILLLLVSTAYLYYTNQLRFLLNFKWQKIEKWLLNTVLGVITLSWMGTFTYNYLISKDDNKVINNQNLIFSEVKKINEELKVGQQDILVEIDSTYGGIEEFIKTLPEEIEARIESKATLEKRKIEELVLENWQLRDKIEKLSIANINKALQDKVEKHVLEYRYKEAQNLIDLFLEEEVYIENSDLAKLYYQKSLIHYAQFDFENSKKDIKRALSLEKSSLEMFVHYENILDQIANQIDNNNSTSSNSISNKYPTSSNNKLIISADKMDIVYRGVKNPLSISFTGIPNNKVTAFANGLKKISGSSYILEPSKGRTMTIEAIGVLPNGKKVSDSKTFRIKDIPRPTGTIRGEDGGGGPLRMERQGLEISSINAELLDFDFDLTLNVTGFSLKVSGEPTVKVRGKKLNSQAKGILRRAKRGGMVQIFDITANIDSNSGYRLKKITPIVVELTD